MLLSESYKKRLLELAGVSQEIKDSVISTLLKRKDINLLNKTIKEYPNLFTLQDIRALKIIFYNSKKSNIENVETFLKGFSNWKTIVIPSAKYIQFSYIPEREEEEEGENTYQYDEAKNILNAIEKIFKIKGDFSSGENGSIMIGLEFNEII